MRTDSQRKAAYEARMLSTLLDPTGAAVVAKAIANYNAYADDFVPKQLQLRGILNDQAPGSTDVYAAFEAFHGELYHLSKVCAGPSLVKSAGFLTIKWSDASHLAGHLALLKTIALDLYSITIP